MVMIQNHWTLPFSEQNTSTNAWKYASMILNDWGYRLFEIIKERMSNSNMSMCSLDKFNDYFVNSHLSSRYN